MVVVAVDCEISFSSRESSAYRQKETQIITLPTLSANVQSSMVTTDRLVNFQTCTYMYMLHVYAIDRVSP